MKIEIDPRALAAEQAQLIEHYRNRNLLLANSLLRMEEENAALQSRIQEIENVPLAEAGKPSKKRTTARPAQEDI